MKMRKLMSLGLAAALALSLAACGGGKTASTPAPAPVASAAAPAESKPAEPAAKSYKVGICQLVQHVALDAASQGFMDAINAAMPGQVSFDYQNASGDAPTCATIVNGFVSDGVDLMMANATAPLQAAASATNSIPVLGTSITDYATALEISNWTGTVGGNISGTSDLAPLDQQAAMIKEMFPDAKKVAMLYCTAEPNSIFQVNTISGYLKDMGFECVNFAFTDSNDVVSVTEAACAAADVIYIPTDNTAASNTEAIANVVLPNKVPVMAGEEGICAGCGVVTLSISYYDLGYATGEMAVKILNGEDVSKMAVQYAPNVTKEYNAANCEALGLTVPSDYVAIGG